MGHYKNNSMVEESQQQQILFSKNAIIINFFDAQRNRKVRGKKNKRSIKECWKDRIEPVLEKDSFLEASVYHHIIWG